MTLLRTGRKERYKQILQIIDMYKPKDLHLQKNMNDQINSETLFKVISY